MSFIEEFRTDQRASIWGGTRCGKTEFIKRNIAPEVNKYIIWDMKHEWGSFGKCVHSIAELKNLKKGTKIIYQPKLEEIEKDFDQLCYFIIKNMKSVLLIVDEAHMKGVFNRMKPSYWGEVLIKTGGAAGKGVITISQRPQDLSSTCRTQAEWIVTFKLNLMDLEYVGHYCGDVTDLQTQPPYSRYEFYSGQKIFYLATA
jgi:hypothetical protein